MKVVHGIRGFVFDLESDAALPGTVIHVHGVEHNVTTYQDGDFFRILTPGVYNITAERLGYVSLKCNQNHDYSLADIYQIRRNVSLLLKMLPPM